MTLRQGITRARRVRALVPQRLGLELQKAGMRLAASEVSLFLSYSLSPPLTLLFYSFFTLLTHSA